MSNWKNNFLTPQRKETLYRVGKYNMILGDLVKLGFQPEQFEIVKDPWAKKSIYDVTLIAREMFLTIKKAENSVLGKK